MQRSAALCMIARPHAPNYRAAQLKQAPAWVGMRARAVKETKPELKFIIALLDCPQHPDKKSHHRAYARAYKAGKHAHLCYLPFHNSLAGILVSNHT